MLDQSLIAWMANGGERFESREDRRMREHRLAIRDTADATPTRHSIGGLFARWTSRPDPAPELSLATDCCPA